MIKSYRDLEVFQRSFGIDHKIFKLSLTFPKFEQFELASQSRRSAHSIPTNIAEGYGRRAHEAEFRRFLTFALASCDETRVHLDSAFKREYVKRGEYQDLIQECDEIGKMLNKLISSWKNF